MHVIEADKEAILSIGYAGENERTQVKFSFADLAEEFPGGMVVLQVKRPGEDTKYTVQLTIDGTDAYWLVTDYDLAYRGVGECQLKYSSGDPVAKRKIWKTTIDRSIEGSDATIPPTWEDIENDLLEAAGELHAELESYNAITAEATTLTAGSSATAEMDRTGDNPVLRLGIPQGEKGDQGDTGYSPSASVEKTDGVTTITITDKEGTTTATVSDPTENLVLVQYEEPTQPENKIWVDSDSEDEVTVPTMTEFASLSNEITQLEGDIAPVEASATATAAHAVGELFLRDRSLLIALSTIAIGDTITTTGSSPNAATTKISEKLIRDVQVNGTSVLNQGVANVPVANSATGAPGVVGVINYEAGLVINSNNRLSIVRADSTYVKGGTNMMRSLVPAMQHEAVFYGLAKLAGADMASSSNAVGTYTDAAKVAIQKMLGIYQAPWELIREDTFTNATEASHEITVDGNGNAFELTDLVLLFETPVQETPSAKGLYGDIGFYDGNTVIVTTESGSWTQEANTSAHGIVAMIEQDGILLNAIASAQTTTTNNGAMQWRYVKGFNSSAQTVRYIANPVKFTKINIYSVTGMGHYILLGKRKWTV